MTEQHGRWKPTSPSPPTRARLRAPPSAAWAWAHAATPTGGVMCPSYRATGDEQHSTRGRARLLWEMLSGALRKEGFQSEAVHQALDLCLSCKACKSECPVQVDVAAWKSEFLAQHYKGRMHPLHHYIFGFADKLARWGALTPALTNALLTGPLTSPLVKHIVGRSAGTQAAAAGAKSFQRSRRAVLTRLPMFPARRVIPLQRTANAPQRQATKVVLWPDTWNNYYHPQTLVAAEKLLTQRGLPGGSAEGTHLLRTAALRLRPADGGARLSREGSGAHGPADRRRASRSSFWSRAARASSRMSCANCFRMTSARND